MASSSDSSPARWRRSGRTPSAVMTGSVGVEIERLELHHLVEPAFIQHLRESAHRCARPARRGRSRPRAAPSRRGRAPARAAAAAIRPATRPCIEHLQRADDALRVVGCQALRHLRIARGQRACRCAGALLRRLTAPVGAHISGIGRDRRQPLRQRLEVEAGAADDDRAPPRALRLLDGPRRRPPRSGRPSSSRRPATKP